MIVALNQKELIYSGRIDMRNPKKPEFIFPASSLQFRFFGKKAVITVENRRAGWENYMGAIVDGNQKKWKLLHRGETEIVLLDEETDSEHEILFFKRQDSCHEVIIKQLELSEGAEILPPHPLPERKIEVYGDSVSAGEVSEAIDYTGKEDPEHEGEYSNSWYSYAWMTARKLNARLHDVAQGGIPLLNGTGWVAPPVYPGMEYMWDKLHYHPEIGPAVEWDFSRYTPHLVIVAIGQNDSHPEDYMKEEPNGIKAVMWKLKYKELVKKIRKKYENAVIILATTILMHDKSWDEAIDQVCEELEDDRIVHFLYKRNGSGTPGHIRIPEAEEMSDELVRFIEQLDMKIWE